MRQDDRDLPPGAGHAHHVQPYALAAPPDKYTVNSNEPDANAVSAGDGAQ